MSDGPFAYRLFGLRVSSELPLPELGPPLPPEAADVTIRRGAVAAAPDAPLGLSIRDDGALLRIAQVGRYLVAGGRDLLVDADPSASPRNLRLFLLGSAFAAILHQRGLLPLHANAMVVAGRAIGFMGRSGAGKSTLAAWFHDRGFEVLADDVCIVTWDGSGRPLAHPGIPRLRLWREALEASGRRAGDYEAAFDDMDKYNVPTERGPARSPVPLDHLYLLEEAAAGAEAEIARLTGSDAVAALVANTYRGGYLPLMDRTGPHLMDCVRLARAVPVFTARRPWDLARLDAGSAALEAHARALIERRETR
ncbi:MAG: hypothetical protein JOZ90_05360 [Alphaproteobacteria bacterium]|nr:hypothetical protein [Alphaproteobacteria bacterium]MBV9372795.1 hypothetical protein [Alphaproteobacteria bacterium]MBV9900510.1 hypothetical protein [Alphaproteobacteria bacterium]